MQNITDDTNEGSGDSNGGETNTVFWLFFLVTGTVGASFNATAISVLLKCRQMAEQIKHYLISFTLTNILFDLVLASTVFFNGLYAAIGFEPGYLNDIIPAAVMRACLLLSLLQTMLMSLDRMISVQFPNFYLMHIDSKKSAIGVTSIWIAVTLYQIFSSLLGSSNQTKKLFSLSEFVTFSVVYWTSFSIFVSSTGVMMYITKQHVAKMIPKHGQRKSTFKDGIVLFRSAFTIIMACGFLLVFYLPMQLMVTLTFFPESREWRITKVLDVVAYPLCVSQSIVNPILYVFRFKECREKLKSTMMTCKTCGKVAPVQHTSTSSNT